MLDNDFFNLSMQYFLYGVPCGISVGMIVWFVSWCISQLFHFFKALSQ